MALAAPFLQAPISADGSTWLRADFHLHTRADKEFAYPCATDADRNAFVGLYVDALQAANIRLGVVTDHNKFDANQFNATIWRTDPSGIAHKDVF